MPDPNLLLSILIVAGAILFLYIYHIGTRRFDVADREQVRNWRFYGWIDVWLKVSTLTITLLALNFDFAWLLLFHNSLVVRLFGLALAGGAMALFVWAMRSLADQYTPAHVARLPKRLITSGPYRFIRHPVYTANLCLLSALLFVSGSLWIFVNLGILIFYYLPTIIYEERKITERLPEYEAYAQRTGRIFPRLRTRREPEQ